MPGMGFSRGNTCVGPTVEVSLGVDPGLNCTGYALLKRGARGPQLIEAGVIRSTRGRSLAERVLEIGAGVRELIAEHRPGALAIEQVFIHAQHPKTSVLMAHARGAILFAAGEQAMAISHYTPTQVKRLLTGSGRASKEQVQQAVARELGLEKPPEPNDVADACAVALCHFYSLRFVAHDAAATVR